MQLKALKLWLCGRGMGMGICSFILKGKSITTPIVIVNVRMDGTNRGYDIIMYRRQRSDLNQEQIVGELRQLGCTVIVVSAREKFDLLVGNRGRNYMFEVKRKGIPLRPKQKKFHDWWKGKINRIESIEDCIRIMEKDV